MSSFEYCILNCKTCFYVCRQIAIIKNKCYLNFDRKYAGTSTRQYNYLNEKDISIDIEDGTVICYNQL